MSTRPTSSNGTCTRRPSERTRMATWRWFRLLKRPNLFLRSWNTPEAESRGVRGVYQHRSRHAHTKCVVPRLVRKVSPTRRTPSRRQRLSARHSRQGPSAVGAPVVRRPRPQLLRLWNGHQASSPDERRYRGTSRLRTTNVSIRTPRATARPTWKRSWSARSRAPRRSRPESARRVMTVPVRAEATRYSRPQLARGALLTDPRHQEDVVVDRERRAAQNHEWDEVVDSGLAKDVLQDERRDAQAHRVRQEDGEDQVDGRNQRSEQQDEHDEDAHDGDRGDRKESAEIVSWTSVKLAVAPPNVSLGAATCPGAPAAATPARNHSPEPRPPRSRSPRRHSPTEVTRVGRQQRPQVSDGGRTTWWSYGFVEVVT